MSEKSKNLKRSREKQASFAKEKILSIKREILEVVELMLETNVSEEWFTKACSKLCKQDYQDVIEERNVEHLCGYPLCNNVLKNVTKQNYRISATHNKVYNISERKCFCCNECYTASEYIKLQLPEVPLYMRKTATFEEIKLLSESNNKAAPGEEIVFIKAVRVSDVEAPAPVIDASGHFKNILEVDVKGCEEQIAKLEIKENIYKKPYLFDGPTKAGTSHPENDVSSEASDEEAEDEDGDDRTLFPEHDNTSILSTKLMPLPKQKKEAVFISPLKYTNSPSVSTPVTVSIERINNIFQDWFTDDTMKFILGEKEFFSIKADMMLNALQSTETVSNSEKMSSLKNEYVELCVKMDKLKVEKDCGDLGVGIIQVTSSVSGKTFRFSPDGKVEKCEEKVSGCASSSVGADVEVRDSNWIPKRKPRKKTSDKKKSVTFQEVEKKQIDVSKFLVMEETVQDPESTNPEPESMFPLVDSVSQNALRRQLLLSKLKSVYVNILPAVGLHYTDIRNAILAIIETFSLSPTNVTYKPKEWNCIAVVLFKILSETKLRNLENIDLFKLWETSKQPTISLKEIENLSINLISADQIRRMILYK